MLNIPASNTQYDYIPLRGGLDLVTPTLALKPGYVRDALNWEQSINGGYSRISGYERFDGRAAPSAAGFTVLLADISGSIEAGDTITGGTSGATGKVISVEDSVVAYTLATGTFVVGEDLEVSATVEGEVLQLGGAIDREDWAVTQRALAANVYRALITAVPGSGPVRGVAYFGDTVYAWRNNVGATALAIYKSTGSGWTAVTLNRELAFDTGVTEFVEGEVITAGAASATILRVCLEDGSWTGGDAKGRFIIGAVTGGPFAAGAATGSIAGDCAIVSADAAVTLAPGGRVEVDIGNLSGARRMYVADGVNRAYEFDGTVVAPINTGNATDTPRHVLVHQEHLFLTFGASLQHSALDGAPFDWTVSGGAAEYRQPDTITGLIRMPGNQDGGVAAILMESTTRILYGSSAANFKPVDFEDATGCKAYTQAKLGQVFMLDDGGVFGLSTSQNFGNFSANALTMNIRPWTQVRRNLARQAIVNREKSQYRVFFSDGFGLYITMVNGKLIGSMPVLFPDPVYCACQGETPDGRETSFFGSDDGFVYRLDAGTSFDGDEIDHYMTLVYASQGNSRVRKRYRAASLEVSGEGFAQFDVTYELGYGGPEPAQGVAVQRAGLNLSTVYWDDFTWDDFTWDGRTLAPTEIELNGTAENIALRIAGRDARFEPITINSLVLHYTPRRGLRLQ